MTHTNCNCGTVHEQVLVLRTCQHIAMSKTSNNVQWDALPDGVPMAAGNQLACHLPGRSTYNVSDALEQMSCISYLHQARPTPACPYSSTLVPSCQSTFGDGRERERERDRQKSRPTTSSEGACCLTLVTHLLVQFICCPSHEPKSKVPSLK